MFAWLLISAVHSLPLRDCSDHRPCYITAYKDAEAASGQLLDWYCRDHTYDDHQGTDFGIGGFAQMDQGRPVFATADGQVEAVQDGAEDRCTTGRCEGGNGLGNFIFIRHEDGSQSRFAHLRRGSIRVAVGDPVTCATLLAEVGSSGYSTGPHLHFELRVNDLPIEPFAGDCSTGLGVWRRQGGYRELPSTDCPAAGGRDDSQLVDENLPDNSEVEPGTVLEKRWVLRNVGTTTWNDDVRAVLQGQSAWQAATDIALSADVEPQASTTLTLQLQAPEGGGEALYLRYQLTRHGIPFGSPFWVDLRTAAAAETDAGPQDASGGPQATADAGPSPVINPPSAGCGCTSGSPQSMLLWLLLLVPGRGLISRR